MDLEKVLYKRFGYETFREGQKPIIEDVIAKRDVFAMLPTGTGKSLCYLLPGMLRPGLTIIVSPLLSLMEDQVQKVKMHGEKRVAALNGFNSPAARRYIMQNFHKWRFLFLSPEMLTHEWLLKKLQQVKVSLYVVDEAHCISQWGHEFRPEYLELGKIKSRLNNPPCLALTATADDRVKDDVINTLEMRQCQRHIYSIDRPNIALSVRKLMSSLEKDHQLIDLIRLFDTPGIVYYSSRNAAERGMELISDKTNKRVAYYHGGLTTEERILVQQQFLQDELDVICSTNAFGMGVDKANIRFVIHAHMPKNLNNYVQEIGRAGRDGTPSIAVMLAAPEDFHLHQSMIKNELPSPSQCGTFIEKTHTLVSTTNDDYLQAALSVGCSETQAGFLINQLNTAPSGNENELLTHMEHNREQRLQTKLRELQSIAGWVNSQVCRRELLLTAFNDRKLKDSNNPCCDHCGLDETNYEKESNHVQQQKNEDWVKRLHRLLTTSEDETYHEQQKGDYGVIR